MTQQATIFKEEMKEKEASKQLQQFQLIKKMTAIESGKQNPFVGLNLKARPESTAEEQDAEADQAKKKEKRER